MKILISVVGKIRRLRIGFLSIYLAVQFILHDNQSLYDSSHAIPSQGIESEELGDKFG